MPIPRLSPRVVWHGHYTAGSGSAICTAACAVCHKFNGEGGNVGPELTGIASRDRSDILSEILDPNRSVKANYRLWNVTTKGAETYSGRLDVETQTTVEILDIAAQKHVIQRKNIKTLEASQLSIMPTGFEALPPDDLKALIEYLATPHQVESIRWKVMQADVLSSELQRIGRSYHFGIAIFEPITNVSLR